VAAREFRVTVRLDAAAALRPGLTCDAEIVAAERHDVLAVPLQSVVERGGTTGVFRVADGVARFVPVKSGIIAGLEIEIDGLDEGTVIVSGPIQALRDLQDGSHVRADQGRR
jgi:multidrug efflux pump subunit AcrA (membrane-fusion protein)